MNEFDAIVLIGHGSNRAEANADVKRLCRLVRELREPPVRVEAAFLQFATPDVPAVVAALARDGFRSIVLVPIFLYSGTHAGEDIPLLVETERLRRPELTLTLAPPLGIDDRIAMMVWDRVEQAGR